MMEIELVSRGGGARNYPKIIQRMRGVLLSETFLTAPFHGNSHDDAHFVTRPF